MDKEVKKHVAAVRVGDAVGLLARKTWNVLLLNAYDNLLAQDFHKIKVSDLCEITGCNTRNFKNISEVLGNLMTTNVKWDIGGGCRQNGTWIKNLGMSTMIASAIIEDGVIIYEFSKRLSKLLYSPEIYQRISIAQQKLFKSSNSLALWENCIRYVGVGSTGLSDVQEWRELLGATAKTYDQYKDFNKFVISPSVKEINDVSSIEIQPFFKKSGRKITHIGFTVMQKGQRQLAMPELLGEAKSSKEYEELIAYGINEIQAFSWIQEYGYDYIREKLNITKESEKSGKVKKASGFLVSAIKNDYKSEKQVAHKNREKLLDKINNEAHVKRREDLKLKLSKAFAKQAKENYLNALSDQEQESLKSKILEDCNLDTYTSNALRNKGLSAPSIGVHILAQIDGFEQKKNAYIAEKMQESGY
jgi:plasmid replication initiation protein